MIGLLGSSEAFAQATDSHLVTLSADSSASLLLGGTPPSLHLTASNVGGVVTYASDTDTFSNASYQVTSGTDYVIVVSLAPDLPSGVDLSAQYTGITPLGCGTSNSAVPLSATAATVVTGISVSDPCSATIEYVLSPDGTTMADSLLVGTTVTATHTIQAP